MTKKEVWDFIKDNWETISAIAAVSVPVIALFPGYIRALTKSKIELLLAGEDEIQKNGIASFVVMTMAIGLSHVVAANMKFFTDFDDEKMNMIILLVMCCIALLWAGINSVLGWLYARTIKVKNNTSIQRDIENVRRMLSPWKEIIFAVITKIKEIAGNLWNGIVVVTKIVAKIANKFFPVTCLFFRFGVFLVKWIIKILIAITKFVLLVFKIIIKFLIGYDSATELEEKTLLKKRVNAIHRSHDSLMFSYMVLFMIATVYMFSSMNKKINNFWMKVVLIVVMSILEVILAKLAVNDDERGKFGIKLEMKDKEPMYIYSRINNELLLCGNQINQYEAKCRPIKLESVLDDNSLIYVESKDIPEQYEGTEGITPVSPTDQTQPPAQENEQGA